MVSGQDGSSLVAEHNPQGLDVSQAAQLLGLQTHTHAHTHAQTYVYIIILAHIPSVAGLIMKCLYSGKAMFKKQTIVLVGIEPLMSKLVASTVTQ